MAARNAKLDFVVDGAGADLGHRAQKFIACAGFQHEASHQVDVAAGVQPRVRQLVHEFPVF
ncbi:hypothetical protein D3C87_2205610 [compost metagenome]